MQYRIFIVAALLSACASQPATQQASDVQKLEPSVSAEKTQSKQAASTESDQTPAAANIPKNDTERASAYTLSQTMRQDAERLKSNAQTTYDAAQKGCWERFFVSDCLDEARLTYRADQSRARKMEREAKLIERNIKRYDAAQHEAQRNAENAKKDADILRQSKATK